MSKKQQYDITYWGATPETRFARYETIMTAGHQTALKVVKRWCAQNPPDYPCGWARVVFKPKPAHKEFIDWALEKGYVRPNHGDPTEMVLDMGDDGRGNRIDLDSALVWAKQFASTLKGNNLSCIVVDRID